MKRLAFAGCILWLVSGCGGSEQASSDDASPASQPWPAECVPSDDDRAMLAAVNEARAAARSCGDRVYPPAPALTWSCTLMQAALHHSTDMATHNFFSHAGSDGLQVGDRATGAGYTWRTIGENIAAGQTSVPAVMQAWLDSPGHCTNIMNPSYIHLGAGYVTNDNADYRIYWTQVFGRPR